VYVDRDYPERALQAITAFLKSPAVAVWRSGDSGPPTAPDPIAELRRDLVEARSRISTLSAERKRLQRELAEARSHAGACRYAPPAVYADPCAQFRYDVEQHWLRAVPESERQKHVLADYDIGPDFLDSVTALQVVDRDVVLAAAVDVLTGQVSVKNGRRAHRQRVGRGGGTAPLVRADGAVGWRCDIRSATPAAPRLLWWALPDGRVELAKAAVHDDQTMR
jgi:hypothetical protein